jgi:V8-like Glu-specific endopeptidase
MKPIFLKAVKYDFALIKLSHNINRHEYFQLYQNSTTLSSATVCGFSDSETLKYHSNPLSSIKDGIIHYNIDTLAGQSGCPVFDKDKNEKLIGIHKGYSPDKHLNMAVLITS